MISGVSRQIKLGIAILCVICASPKLFAQNTGTPDETAPQIIRIDSWSLAQPDGSTEMGLWVTFHFGQIAQTQLAFDLPAGSLTNIEVSTTPTKDLGNSPLISRAELKCLDDKCVNFNSKLFFVGLTTPVELQRRRENRTVQVYTDLDDNLSWYKPAVIDFYRVPHGFSSMRMREFSNNNEVLFDVEGGLNLVEGICKALTHYAPWAQRTQTCLEGVADDGSFIIRLKPIVQIKGGAIPFDLPMERLNEALAAGKSNSVWLKVMPINWRTSKPLTPPGKSKFDISKLPAAIATSQTGKEMIREIEFAAEMAPVRERIEELWLDKWKGRLGHFLTTLKGDGLCTLATQSRPCDAQIMKAVLEKSNFPQVTSIVTLIESNFSPAPANEKQAAGYWQFIPATALEYGLKIDSTVDERLMIGPSTTAAVHLLLDLMTHFKGPNAYKLALASYNSGQNAVDRQQQALIKKQKGLYTNQDVILETGETLRSVHDFWDLYTYHLLYQETRNYVVDIMAASYLALHPELAQLDAKLALDRAKKPLLKH